MKKIKWIAGFVLVTTGLIALPSCQSSKTNAASSKMLKFNLEKGKGYDYDMSVDMDMSMMGQKSSITADGQYSMVIVEENGAAKTISTNYKSIKMSMGVGGMNIDLDTEKPTEGDFQTNPIGAMNKLLAGFTNKPFTIQVDAEGNVLKVEGFTKIVMDVFDSLDIEPAIKEKAMQGLKDKFNDDAMKDNFTQMFTIFPNKEVKIGDSWTKSYRIGGEKGNTTNTKYTVKDIDGDHVTLQTDSKISGSVEGREVSGTQGGTIIVDSKTGLLVNADYDQDMKIVTTQGNVDMIGKIHIKGKAR